MTSLDSNGLLISCAFDGNIICWDTRGIEDEDELEEERKVEVDEDTVDRDETNGAAGDEKPKEEETEEQRAAKAEQRAIDLATRFKEHRENQ